MDMDSYLSSIDAYMKQQEQQEEEEQIQQQQQQQKQANVTPPSQFHPIVAENFDFSNQNLNDIWLNNLPASPDIPLYYNSGSNTVDTDIFLTDISALPGQVSHDPLSNFPPEPIYLTNPATQPPSFDAPGQPIRIRKKPGRKPNPASPALRKAQNRAAQRAFRERKERHLKDLENSIRSLREQRNNATKELNAVKKNLESFKVENWYLKGIVLTLQLICSQNNIGIATHTPYLTEDFLKNMAKTAPQAVDAYISAVKKNNLNLKDSMSGKSNSTLEAEYAESMETETQTEEQMDCEQASDQTSTKEEEPDWLSKIDESDAEKISSYRPIPKLLDQELPTPLSSSLDAIHYIRLKLGLKAALANSNAITDISAARLKPTILQLAIPHDPRIDLIPTPHMRDRMIIFKEQMDHDRCFSLLLSEAVYHGGDPTLSESWELPEDFFREFWYLCVYYDVRKTNKWRRIKGLADVSVEPQGNQHAEQATSRGLKNSDVDSRWNEEALDEIIKNMPVLKPVIEDSAPPRKFESNDVEMPEYYYERLMGTTPEARPTLSTPSYENIVELMKSLKNS